MHHFIEVNNHVGDTLDMRWKKTVKGNPPSAWKVNFADPESNHPDISMIDSVDFILPDSASNWTYNKFVIGVNPNGAVGNGQYIFTIFERSNPADSLRIYYTVEVYTGIHLAEQQLELSLYPNPADQYVYIPSFTAYTKVSLWDVSGREYPRVVRVAGSRLDVSAVPQGNYILKLEGYGHTEFVKIRIAH